VQIEVRECLLSFGAELFVFQFAIQRIKNSDIQNYNFSCFLHWCKTWSFTLREEHKLRVFDNGVLRKIFGSKEEEVTRSGNNYIMHKSVTCIPHRTLFG
jgi:hypothetical protein